MGSAKPPPTLQHLRQTLAGIDPSLAPQLREGERAVGLTAPIDAVLGGGLAGSVLHELAPSAPIHLAAATGFAAALTALAAGPRGEALWIATDFAVREGGGPYGPGLDRYGMAASRLLVLRVPRPLDVLWAMEEALRCRALACVIAELTGEGPEADLTATRRLTLAAHEGQGLGLLLRHRVTPAPSAAVTRWQVAACASEPDGFGGLGRTRFDLALGKNRRGPSGRWIIEWNHHEHEFRTAVPFALVATALDRPDRAPLARAG
jgi:protein ImuA